MIPITLRQLEILVQIVEAGNFRRCAERIGVSQVAISDHVRSLESAVGGRLFTREPGLPASLTPLGRRVHTKAAEILEAVSVIVSDNFEHRSGDVRSVLKISAPTYVIARVQPLVTGLQESFADFRIEFVARPLPPGEVRQQLAAGFSDVHYGFRFADAETDGGRLLYEEPLGFFARADHPLQNRDDVSFEELSEYSTVHLSADNPLRVLVDQAWSKAGLTAKSVMIESDDLSLLISTAAHSDAFVCMFASADDPVAQSSNLKRLPVTQQIAPIAVFRFLSERAAGNASVRKIVSKIDASLRAENPSRRLFVNYERS